MLTEDLEESQKFKEVLQDINNKISPIALSGLSDVGKVRILSEIQIGRAHV